MRPFRVQIEKIKKHYYVRIPILVANLFKLKDKDELEISIHQDSRLVQEDLWLKDPQRDMEQIQFQVSMEGHSMNMYNRLYIPEKYRFFFPSSGTNCMLVTNIGNIRTHLTTGGFFMQGMRPWFSVNGPLSDKDKLVISVIPDQQNWFYMNVVKIDEKIPEPISESKNLY